MIARRTYVHAVGLSCPVGRRSAPACAAIRAGISRRGELPYLDQAKRPIIGSMAQFVPARNRIARMVSLARDALGEALGDDLSALERMPLVLAVPTAVASTDAEASQLVTTISQQLAVKIEPSRTWLVPGDGAASFEALSIARQQLARGSAAVLVCASDSLVCAQPLLELHERRRLLTEDDPDGVAPGEAAACVVLSGERRGARSTIEGIGLAEEPASLFSDEPLRGTGARNATRIALQEAGIELHDVDFRLGDAAGESYAFKEQALLMSRLLRRRKERFPLWLPASSLGDTGAAAGLVSLVMATVAFTRGHAPGARALALAGSPVGPRRAALVCAAAG